MACFMLCCLYSAGVESINLENLVGSDNLKTKLKNTLVPQAFYCENCPIFIILQFKNTLKGLLIGNKKCRALFW